MKVSLFFTLLSSVPCVSLCICTTKDIKVDMEPLVKLPMNLNTFIAELLQSNLFFESLQFGFRPKVTNTRNIKSIVSSLFVISKREKERERGMSHNVM